MAQYYANPPPGHGLYTVPDVPVAGYAGHTASQNVVLEIEGKPPPPSHPRPKSPPRAPPDRSTSDESAAPRRGVSDYLRDQRTGRRGPRRYESSMSSASAADDDRRERSRRHRRRQQSLDETTDSRDSYYQKGANVMDQGTLCGSRALLSAVAVLLLWVTSFTAITNMLRLADALPAPEFYTVVEQIEELINETRRVRVNYIDNIKGNLKVRTALRGPVSRLLARPPALRLLLPRPASRRQRREPSLPCAAQYPPACPALRVACARCHPRPLPSPSACMWAGL